MGELLLDTSVLIDFLIGGRSLGWIERRVAGDRARISISIVTAAEYLVKGSAATLQRLLDSGSLHLHGSADLSIPTRAARIRAETGMALPDAFIVATAEENASVLVTLDETMARHARRWVDVEVPS